MYLGGTALRENVTWIPDGNGHKLCQVKTDSDDPNDPAVLSTVVPISDRHFFHDKDAFWNPDKMKFAVPFEGIKYSFQAGKGADSPFNDRAAVMENALWLQEGVSIEDEERRMGWVVKAQDDAKGKGNPNGPVETRLTLKWRHRLIEVSLSLRYIHVGKANTDRIYIHFYPLGTRP